MTLRQWQNWMVEGTTLRCGRHAKPVVWEAERHPHLSKEEFWSAYPFDVRVSEAEWAVG
ncbi:BQ5605_C017g08360 [Microbotryum silenes-dioicae]|uniref:BQ5605_C017g08360 protein n=1 Tax=Microbotryum silenes-dioicae TaxID=796604 RepID=A0A2X0LUR6_9BASI|nr:BQ5605_C017g08360 [Microbotryum silenes-dioicae]